MKLSFRKKEIEKDKINPKKYMRLVRDEKRRYIIRIVLFLIITVLIAGFISAYQYFIPVYKEMKDDMFEMLSSVDSGTFLRAGNTDIYDADGNLLGRLGNEKYQYVDVSQISPYVTKGYIAKEDRNFSVHMGVDIKGTVRAMVAYVKHHGQITQGGSTITQQVIKNNLLTQEKAFKRKITEIFLALQMEKEYNKAQIMEFYCNSNYYGNGCYGIEGASQYYFGHSAYELSLGEAAMLVATSNSPNHYNPVADYERAMEEKESVLDDMLECGYITEDEHGKALLEEPEIVRKSENVANENYMITYAIHCAALKIMEKDGFEFQYTYESSDEYKEYDERYSEAYHDAVEEVREGGYKIYTSLNPSIQKILQESIDEGTKEYKDKQENGAYDLQVAGAVVDNQTGLICAVVGGREEKGSYNRGYQAKRQPGSSIKPLIDYGPAYNEGIYTPSSVLVDEEVDVNGYKPKNAWKGYKGEITTREALLRSYNTIAVKTYLKVTKPKALSYLDSMHFSTLTYSDMVAPSLAVGGFTTGASVVDMAKGYATIAMGGSYVENNCILSLVSYTGKQIYKHNEKKKHEVFNVDTAFMLTDILSGMFQEDFMPGTKAKKSDQIYMGKTGTTNDNKDAWFCGSSVYYSASIWMGYDIPKEMKGIAGGNKPCEIWASFMDHLHDSKKLKKSEFAMPDTIMLADKSGNTKKPEYTDNVYKSRPEDMDYVSMVLKKKREEALAEEDEKRVEEEAKSAVKEYEDFQITTVDQAREVEDKYNHAFMYADAVEDRELRKELLERIAYKHQLISGELEDKWADAMEAYEKTLQAQRNEENAEAAELSEEQAEEAIKNARVSFVECYIRLLNMQTQYFEAMETWIVKAEDGIAACVDYPDEHERLLNELNASVERIRDLQMNMLANQQDEHDMGEDAEHEGEVGTFQSEPSDVLDDSYDTE